MNLPAVLFVLVAGSLLLALPRRWAALPLVVGATYMTLGPSLDAGPFHFTVIRLLVAIGFIRVAVRQEWLSGGLTTLDWLLICWAITAVLTGFLHRNVGETLIFRLGLAYNALGLYFLLRTLAGSPEHLPAICKMVLLALVPIAAEMVFEAVTGRNLFSVFDGVPALSEIRGGRIRAQGSFSHSILAGTVGAVCLPLAMMWWNRSRAIATMGLVSTATMVACSRSSGPIMSAMFALFGLGLWNIRQHFRLFWWMMIVGLVGLTFVMDAPIYYVISRIDLTGSSTGWHRAYLIESAIKYVGDWWLAGTDYTRNWTPNSGYSDAETDITNHYVRMAVWGGMPMLLLFVACLTAAFRRLRATLRALEQSVQEDQFVVWTLGCCLFAHVTTMISVSYFDQSVFFLYFILAVIGSLPAPHEIAVRTGQTIGEPAPAEA